MQGSNGKDFLTEKKKKIKGNRSITGTAKMAVKFDYIFFRFNIRLSEIS